uniref:P2X purinoceptor n=1 Tax=Pavo cristatus TaxID=9049 RepID=A0A8C9F1X1_PAVCR
MAMGQRCMDKLSSFLFEYDTPRMVLVRNKKVGLTFRVIQLVVLAYIIGWVFLYEKGYQTQDNIVSSVSVKLKGLTLTNESTLGPHIWDVVDYVFPPQGDSSFVVMTNFIITPGQKQGTCPELPDAGLCSQDSDCSEGTYSRQGQGIMTGKCINFNTSMKTCEIFGWCPAEVDYYVPNPALLPEVENFTIFIKNSITFPKFKVSRRNIVESITTQYLRKCTYHKVTDSLCPMFDLGYVVKESGQNFSMLAVKVRKILLLSPAAMGRGYQGWCHWDKGCAFPRAAQKKVTPVHRANWVGSIAGMVSWRAAPTRPMICFKASVLCDLLLLHFLQGRDYYKQKKFKYAEQEPSKKGKELDSAQ